MHDSSFLRRSLRIDGVASGLRGGTEPACLWPNRASSRSCPDPMPAPAGAAGARVV